MENFKSKLNKLIIIILTTVLSTSCGGGGNQSDIAKVKPDKVEISGDLADYLQVVDNEYEITDDWGGKLTIKVKAIKQMSVEELKANDFNLSASLLGENGSPVSGTGEFTVDIGFEDKLLSLLKKGSGEEVIQLKEIFNNYKAEEHASKCKKFTVSSTMTVKEEANVSANDTSEDSASIRSDVSTDIGNDYSDNTTSDVISDSGNEDFDKMLVDYDDYVTQYIKFYKKAMKGDDNAFAEYPALMEKATVLSRSMKKAKSENKLTAKQIKKMMEIEMKMLQAASEK